MLHIHILKIQNNARWPCGRRGVLGLGAGHLNDEDFWTEGVEVRVYAYAKYCWTLLTNLLKLFYGEAKKIEAASFEVKPFGLNNVVFLSFLCCLPCRPQWQPYRRADKGTMHFTIGLCGPLTLTLHTLILMSPKCDFSIIPLFFPLT